MNRSRGVSCWCFLALFLVPRLVMAQHILEARGADTRYRYFDWTWVLPSSVLVDCFYVGVPGSNEFNFGGGYGIKPVPSLMVAPVGYAVVGKEGRQRGVKVGLLLSFEKSRWKGNAFLAHYIPAGGAVPRYDVLDTADFTRALRGGWEAGVSAGFFHTDAKWNPQVGPVVKRNDRLGAWALSYRLGPQGEWRVARIVVLRK